MDARTMTAYEVGAVAYCDDWLAQPPPQDLQTLWRSYFLAGGATADVGSGSGRDVDWLNCNGYPCVGWDASQSLLVEARRRFPRWRFETAVLPLLAEIPDASYDNVVCETVIMHLPAEEVEPSVHALRRILAAGGTLYLSWRVTDSTDVRDAAGRLYCAFPAQAVRAVLAGATLLYDQEETSASSGRRVHRLIVRLPA